MPFKDKEEYNRYMREYRRKYKGLPGKPINHKPKQTIPGQDKILTSPVDGPIDKQFIIYHLLTGKTIRLKKDEIIKENIRLLQELLKV